MAKPVIGPPQCTTPRASTIERIIPHDVAAHRVSRNALTRSTPSLTHQPRSWSKAEAPLNISCILVTLSTRQLLSGWLNAEASSNIESMSVTPEVSHALMSWLNAAR